VPRQRGNQEKLTELTEIEEKQIVFSFVLLDVDGDRDFNPGLCNESNILPRLLSNLRDISKLTFRKLRFEQKDRFDFHPIKWADTSKSGFRLDEQYLAYTPYQLQISGKGRFHGFFYDNHVFFVVWCDPLHKLYPFQNRGK